MRYCSIKDAWPSRCHFGVVCSECGCDVAFGDTYCKRCGRKLNKLQEYVSTDFVLEKITEAVRCGRVPEKGEFVSPTVGVGTRRDSDTTTVGTGRDSDNTTSPTIKTVSCPWGRDPKTCGCLGLDGVCYFVVYPTYPPRHAYCPYSGKHGYVSDARESLAHSIVQEDSAGVSSNAEGDKV